MPSVASRSSAVVVPSVSAKVAWREERPGSRRKEARKKQEGEQERIRRKDDRPFMFFRVPPSSSPTPPPAGQVTWLWFLRCRVPGQLSSGMGPKH